MAPPKKTTQKMDLASFLADDTLDGDGDSWGGDYTPESIATQGNVLDIGSDIQVGALPDQPPYTAKISNFPGNSTEESLEDFFIKGMAITNPVDDIESFRAPRDQLGELRGFAFITFTTRDLLEKALTLNDRFIESSKVYVSVATPPKNDRRPRRDDSFDFAGARGSFQQQSSSSSSFGGSSRFGSDRERDGGEDRERRPRREENFDFAGVRGSMQQQQQPVRRERFGGDREERRPRREENFDFAGVRGSLQQQEPVRDREHFRGGEQREREERKPRREEPALDFTAIRGSMQQKEPEHRPTFVRKPKRDDGLDFSGIRGTAVQQSPASGHSKRAPVKKQEAAKKNDAPVASAFAMLALDDDDEE